MVASRVEVSPMKKCILFFLLFLALIPAWGQKQCSFWAGMDTAAIDSIWKENMELRMEAGLRLDSGFGIRVPITWIKKLKNDDVSLFDLGIFLDYHPFDDGVFISLGLAEGAFYFGRDKPQETECFLNEISAGYTWHFTPHWFIEPKLIIRDPSGVFETEYASLKETFAGYSVVRFSLVVGGDFLAFTPKSRDSEGSV